MKTAEEIYNQEDYIAGCQTDGVVNKKEVALKAMKAYASQAIDHCAESAKTKNQGYDHNGNDVIVDKQSILNVKFELK